MLLKSGISADVYHAGLSDKKRVEVFAKLSIMWILFFCRFNTNGLRTNLMLFAPLLVRFNWRFDKFWRKLNFRDYVVFCAVFYKTFSFWHGNWQTGCTLCNSLQSSKVDWGLLSGWKRLKVRTIRIIRYLQNACAILFRSTLITIVIIIISFDNQP